ncbi:hypothetical protein ABLO26_14405 [Neobacillus sp. 179-J 1A1 HS]|uniref:hypothetical protein n=1 Tax=Neobacillus driksii TaxID=3035913 RepID=UPI0035BBA65D
MSNKQNNNQQDSTFSEGIKQTTGSAFQPEQSALETKNAGNDVVDRTVNITNKLTENA